VNPNPFSLTILVQNLVDELYILAIEYNFMPGGALSKETITITIPLPWIKLICLSKMEVGMINGRGGQHG
jgi:hypothetical protein